MFVVLGRHYLNDIQEKEKFLTEKIIIHPKYNDITLVNDVALLKLQDRISFRRNVSPVCLPLKKYRNYEEMKCEIAGFGQTHINTSLYIKFH